ncbi:protein-L-isoaspartate O-methyltransferase, partial [Entophlyctis helioformis]
MPSHFSGASNSELVDNLQNAGVFTAASVGAAMKKVDRSNFVTTSAAPYNDNPVQIGFNATISAPHMHAHALNILAPFLKPGMRALDAEMVGETGTVVGVDHIQDLVDMARTNLAKHSPDLERKGRVTLHCGDGRNGTFTTPAVPKFDAIHVGAAAATVPQTLVDQLASPGLMCIPVGPAGELQMLYCVEKDADGRVTQTEVRSVKFVPLTEASVQLQPG